MSFQYKISFNKPHLTNKEIGYIKHAHDLGQLAGDGFYTKKCHEWIEKNIGSKALLTHSCSTALEMMAILSKVKPGDEIIMPSFTFVTTANAFVLRGAKPVFVDIREDTLNIDERLIANAITSKTKAIVVVHYAGVSCDMDAIKEIAKKNSLLLLEDAAQGFLSKYKGQYLGTLGDMGGISFHETKNIISGEGGVLLVNNKKFSELAEIVREKGTDRSKFMRGQVDKYTWVDIGSSYLPGEIVAAFLYAQLEQAYEITQKRISIWNKYHEKLKDLEEEGLIRRPFIPSYSDHNGHLYYLLVNEEKIRNNLIKFLKKRGIYAPFHYVPLHSSLAGKKYARFDGNMEITNRISGSLIRLPLFYDIKSSDIEYIVKSIYDFFGK